MANSLEGRGENLGKTLEISNEYLEKLNPETQAAVSDIIRLGQVSQTYASRMDEFGRLLRNSSKISRTVVDKQNELSDLFRDTDRLADVLNTFFDKTGDDLIATVNNSVKPLQTAADYSSVFPCWFKGLDYFLRTNMDSVLKNGTLHIDLIMISPQPTVYDQTIERPTIPTQATFDAADVVDPDVHGLAPDGTFRGLGTICDELTQAAAGRPPRGPTRALPTSGAFWKLWGVRNSHNGKLDTDAAYNRVIAAGIDLDSPAQTRVLKNMTSVVTGVTTDDVPDVASLLLSPLVRGAAVEVERRADP